MPRRYSVVIHIQPGAVGHAVECPACGRVLHGLTVDANGLIDGLTVVCRSTLSREERDRRARHRRLGAATARCDTTWRVHLAAGRLELVEAERRRERRVA